MIKTENLSFKYNDAPDAVSVLKNISLEIKNGEFVAVLGHNGSGKSTLARHFNALLTPTSGTAIINGLDTANPDNHWEIRKSTGMVFQNPDNQIIATIVEEDIAFGPENLGIPPAEIRERVDAALKTVGLSDYAASPPHHLSGGQKQRVAIAGVLAMQPDCIILDEPTAMLDPSGRREVMDTILKLNKERNITIVLITHFMEEAVCANRVLVMHDGDLMMDDTPRNIFSQVDKMTKLGLGVPQVTKLSHELIKKGHDLPGNILTVEEFIKNPTIKNISANPFPRQAKPTKSNPEKTQPKIIIQNLTHIYNKDSVFEKKALDNINLIIHSGEMLGLIGHTGSGKSTLIQHLNALLSPTSGQIIINNHNIHENKSNIKNLRKQVGLVFQYPEHQLFEETVYKDVAFGPTKMGLSENEIDEQVRKALKLVNLSEETFEKSPFELSGGQKRRAAIAGVLAMSPEILILDEPAAGLDPAGREEILSQIKQMHETLGLTVILVSHSMDDAARLAERVVVMNQGKIICDGIPAEVFCQDELLLSIGLDTPQISRLMTQLTKTNPTLPTNIFTVEDAIQILTNPTP